MPRDLVKLIEDLRIEQMGCAGMIPGLQRSIDAAQAEMARLRARMRAPRASYRPRRRNWRTASDRDRESRPRSCYRPSTAP